VLTLLVPPLPRLLRERTLGPELARLLGRADRLPDLPESRSGQLEVLFDVEPRPLGAAALTRSVDVGDHEGASWLRADPAHALVDMAAVRLMACGRLELEAGEVKSIGATLTAMFAEEGLAFDTPAADRWYLRLDADAALPLFHPPEAALGADMEDWLPAGRDQGRWRRLLNEAQMLLHAHPVNAARARQGQLAVNSLWFWGAGGLPERISPGVSTIVSDDPLLRALAARSGTRCLAAAAPEACKRALVDLAAHEAEALLPWFQRAARGAELVFAGGERFRLAAWHRLRFWRGPWVKGQAT
jgi:hypothetical protein